MDRQAVILRADARHLPLADNTVDLVVTSPPYFGLRSYQDGGEHYTEQIGSEATPAEFVDALVDVTRECVRVLKPSGSLWVNLGDKYAGGGGQWDKDTREDPNGFRSKAGTVRTTNTGGKTYGLRSKSLIGVPWRYALRCIDDLGLILRAEVIWAKPNGLPESVTDRVRRSHETWFHFTLSPRYFSAVDEVREAHLHPLKGGGEQHGRHDRGAPGFARHSEQTPHPLGKLPGSVWTIPTQPLTVPAHLGVDHFAAFPMEFPRRIIRGWSPSGICVECGEGRRPVTTADRDGVDYGLAAVRAQERVDATGGTVSGGTQRSTLGNTVSRSITGEACACPESSAPTRPSVVLDPFGGTGTTALVASALGRRGVSVDYSADYCRLARWRTTDPGQRAAAMQVEKPAAQIPGQADLFDGAA